MSRSDALLRDAAALRAAFDRAFTTASVGGDTSGEDFLLLRVGGDPYALRVLELAEITRDARVVPLPSADPSFVGLTSLRGVMVPVFALGVLLGYPPGVAPGTWLARYRHADGMIAFAFEGAEGFFRGVASTGRDRGAHDPRAVVAVGGAVRPVVQVADLFADIDRRALTRRKGSS